MSKSFKDILNDILSPEQKVALKAEFNALPVIAPVVTPDAVAPVVPATFGEGKLSDGTAIKYDTETLAVGSIVMIVTPDGELPAPDGELELENGDKIYITNGVVDKIEAKEVDAAPVIEPMAEAKVSNPMIDVLKVLINSNFETQTKEVNALKAVVAEQTKALQAFQSFFNTLVETPTGSPVVKEDAFLSKRKQILVGKYLTNNN